MLGDATFPIPETGGQIPDGASTVWPPPALRKGRKATEWWAKDFITV